MAGRTEVGAELIAEGVENAGELKALHELNVHKAQGFYFGRPGPLPHTLQAAGTSAERRQRDR